MERRTFRNNAGTASRKLNLRDGATKVANLTVDAIKQMEAELHKASNLTPHDIHFSKVYAGVINGHFYIFSNYEFQQYLTAYSILAEVIFSSTPCPCAVVAVVFALSKAEHPSKEDMQVPYIVRFIRHLLSDLTHTDLESVDWGDILLHKSTSEDILATITKEAAE